MTGKKIIIDGCDVSGCIFHSLTTMGYVGYNYCKCFEVVCECHNDCYYKQLLRKEHENKVLEDTYNALRLRYSEDTTRLSAELELKKEECNELKELNTRLDRQREAYWKGYQKLDKALTEIKEIAEKQQSWNETNRKCC